MMRKRRYSDNNKHFWPFTLALDCGKRFGIEIDSGEDEYPGCKLIIHLFTFAILCELPPIIRPWRRKVIAHTWDAATVERLGRNWYWDEHRRAYGFTYSDGFLHVRLGRQTHDSDTTQSWGCHLPWTQWRHVRHCLYDTEGNHYYTQPERTASESHEEFTKRYAVIDACRTVSFEFNDFDDERIVAHTKIEERVYLFGTGYFKWLSWFRKPKIYRSLDIKFSKEVGRRKGSWKGGTVGHGIDMKPGEMHNEAFRRYCVEHKLEFLGQI